MLFGPAHYLGDPSLIPPLLLKVCQMGVGLTWKRPLPWAEGSRQLVHVRSNSMRIKAPAEVSCLSVPMPWLPPRLARPLVHSTLCASRGVRDENVNMDYPSSLPTWLVWWVQRIDRTRGSLSETVQNIRDVYLQDLNFGPLGYGSNSVVLVMITMLTTLGTLWSREAEAGLLRACRAAGGPALAGTSSSGRGKLISCTSRLGGRCKDCICRTDPADPVDVASAGSSSTPP